MRTSKVEIARFKNRSEREKKAFEYWKTHPVEAVKDWFKVTPEDYQGDILNGVFCNDKDRVAAKSAHGVGKTTTLSWAGWIFLNCYEQSRLVATAPTFPQLHDALWPEYAKWQVQMPDQLQNAWDISGNHIRHKGFPKTWFGVSRTSNKPSNLQGFHGTDIMVQADEMSGIEADVFEVIEGILSEAGEEGKTALLLGMGNPNFNAGEFYNAFHANKELYERFTISGDPAIFSMLDIGEKNGTYLPEHGRVYLSPRVTKKYVETMRKKYGEDGGVFDVRVRGLFPRQEDAAVIPLAWAQRAASIDLPTFDKVAHPVTLVMDVARMGADETVRAAFRQGHLVRMEAWAKTTTEQCVDHLADEIAYWKAHGVEVSQIIIDEPGVGGGVIDAARRRGMSVTPYHGGEGLKQGKDPDDDVRMFANRRARDYWYTRRKFEAGAISIIDDETLINQLASVHYDYNERDKIQVESKRKMRDRLGDDASPDRADVIVMGTAPWYSFNAANTNISEEDIDFGDDRPMMDMELA